MALKMSLVTCCVLLMYISATRGQLQRLDTESLTCSKRVEQEKLRDQQRLIADKEYHSCDDAGNYNAKQCFGTHHGHCSCVNPMSGAEFADVKGIASRSLHGAAMTCRCALDYNNATERASYCDLDTGDYKPVVCIGEKCRCAERWGAPMNHFAIFNKGDSNCMCARRLADVSGLVGTSYHCDPEGRFLPAQCLGSQCFCVDDEGIQVGLSVFISKYDELEC